MNGLMMDYQLTLPTILRRVEAYFGAKEVVTRLPDKSFHRYTYADMGARGANFYNALVRRYGYDDEAERIQELYLGGKQREAIAAVPDDLIDEVALVGPRERIRDRLDAWRESGVTTLLVGTPDVKALRTLAELVL